MDQYVYTYPDLLGESISLSNPMLMFNPQPYIRNRTFNSSHAKNLAARFAAIERAVDNATPEEKVRLCLDQLQPLDGSADAALDRIFRFIDQEGPFDGVLGHSEGTAMAATVLLEERRRFRQTGRPQQLKCGIFFNGFPALIPGENKYLLADDKEGDAMADEDRFINVPTVHVLGSLDPSYYTSLALYNVCCPEKASLFDHGGGHGVPRDVRTIRELGKVVRAMITPLK
ncbi:serine hydrolase-domain-containing protein [Aspergillus caelatus]|uniref:Serine hydrolase-domain-containing protein n=1 Tax=Aspergillus caelatus TaxID=61420 RepID=A0A5N6ZVF8_9EURO|nr:serine hydrolase-domain-containing protein [Aspergillus caelatus]KAE8361502.1 serine hydrolase-domain-containing protein [Aspergillus caelatus]